MASLRPSAVRIPSLAQKPLARRRLDTFTARAAADGGVPAEDLQGADAKLKKALDEAEKAIGDAQESLEGIASLPSARPLGVQRALKVSKVVAGILAFVVLLWASQHMHVVPRFALSFALMASIVVGAVQRKSLSVDGGLAATLVGWVTIFTSCRQGMVLLGFFLASSALTKWNSMEKSGLEEDFKEGGQRNWVQVACNGGIPTVMAAAAGVLTGCTDVALGAGGRLVTLALGAFLGYYGCCAGDTWASEIGVLSTEQPRLITTMRPVRAGTNGGVTFVGLGASAAGGAFVGLLFYLGTLATRIPLLGAGAAAEAAGAAWVPGQWKAILVGMAAGLAGSLIDSIFGATIQFTGYDVHKEKIVGTPGPDVQPISGFPLLSNNAVNLISATITSALTALLAANVVFV